MDSTIILQIPTLAKPTKDSFDIRPKKISEWIETLPRANIGEITRLVYQALRIVNRLDIPSGDRLRFLEQLDEPLQYIAKSFTKHFLNLVFPLPEKRRKIIRLTMDIDAEIAMGYKIPMAAVLNDNAKPDKKSAGLAIHHALFYLSTLLEKYYQIYEQAPAGTWFEVHQLYRYARDNKLHEQKWDEPSSHNALALKSSIDDLYKRILLLSLTQPNHLRQGEIQKISQALKERWVALIQLRSELPSGSTEHGVFITDTNSDNPPFYQAAYSNPPPANQLGLEISALIKALHTEIAQTKEATPTQRLPSHALDQDLLMRLLQTWQISHKRAYPRLKNSLILDITIGLSCTYHYMTQGEWAQSALPNSVLPNRKPNAHANPEPSEAKLSLSDIIYGRETQNRFIKEAFPGIDNLQIDFESGAPVSAPPPTAQPSWQQIAAPNKTETVPAHFVIQQWVMTNLSAGGYCLMWNKNMESQAQVGELIGIHEQKNNVSHWSLGVIRWLRCRNDSGVEIGIQILAPEAKPVQLKPERSASADYFKGFLLPEINILKQPQSVITPTLPFQANQAVQMVTENAVQSTRLTRLLENTSTYRQFLFSSSTAHPNITEKPTSHRLENDGSDFDESIWSTL